MPLIESRQKTLPRTVSHSLLSIYLFVDRALRNKRVILTKQTIQKMLEVFLN